MIGRAGHCIPPTKGRAEPRIQLVIDRGGPRTIIDGPLAIRGCVGHGLTLNNNKDTLKGFIGMTSGRVHPDRVDPTKREPLIVGDVQELCLSIIFLNLPLYHNKVVKLR